MVSYEEQHRQRLVGEEERRPQQPEAVVARPRRQGAELKIFLASTSALELVVWEECFTYEEQHQQDLAGVEERRRQHLVVEALPLCSSLRRRREAEEGLQPGAVAGRLLLLAALAAVVVHLRRRQEV